MGEREKALRARLGRSVTLDGLILLEILEVQEEILEELRYQNEDQIEEQGHTSLSDRE